MIVVQEQKHLPLKAKQRLMIQEAELKLLPY
jgi:hypothetical protein